MVDAPERTPPRQRSARPHGSGAHPMIRCSSRSIAPPTAPAPAPGDEGEDPPSLPLARLQAEVELDPEGVALPRS